MKKIVEEKHIPIIAAAGNKGVPVGDCPAHLKFTITVGATDRGEKLWEDSNHGKLVDILAPGKDIESACTKDDKCNMIESGTSMATPIVTGVVAALLQENKKLRPAQLKNKLIAMSSKLKVDIITTPKKFQHKYSIQPPTTHIKAGRTSTPNRLLHYDGMYNM